MSQGSQIQNILVAGSSGLIGTALISDLKASGYEVSALKRSSKNKSGELTWDPHQSKLDPAILQGYDAVVHLGGVNITASRWSPSFKDALKFSRVDSTKLLSDALFSIEKKPKLFVVASAIGLYGDRGDQLIEESERPGRGFLAELATEWEKAADSARVANIRVVHLRFGIVLSKDGGALAKMLLPFKLGLGGKLGDGTQYVSWIALSDAIRAIKFTIENEQISGAVNIVSPNPVTNKEFTKTLAKILKRPAFFSVPKFALRILVGDMADQALLNSQRAVPRKLELAGFNFKYPTLEEALVSELEGY